MAAENSLAQQRRYWLGLAGLTLGALVLRLVALGELPLIGDEAYYWLWSRRLALSYYDHPAGTALLIRIGTELLGDSELGVRLLNALAGALCVPLLAVLGRRLFSVRAGLIGAAFLALGAPCLITSRFAYTDMPHLALMLTNLLLFTRLPWRPDMPGAEQGSSPSGERRGWCVAWGLSLALLFNVKYAAYLYALGLGVAILCWSRHLLRRRWFWVGVAMGAMGLLPVLWWNATHGWASFAWQLAHLGSASPGGAASAGIHWRVARNLAHAVRYLTWPMAVAAALAPFALFDRNAWLPMLIGACLAVPVILSPADSPRNLLPGLALMLLLAGHTVDRVLARWSSRRRLPGAAAAVLLSCVATYGVGTVLALHGHGATLASDGVEAIRTEVAAARALAAVRPGSGPYLTIDHGLAGQLAFYTEEVSYTPWGQYRIWGPPTGFRGVASLDYIAPSCVEAALGDAFDDVSMPVTVPLGEGDAVPTLYLWRVSGRRVELEALADELSFSRLWETCP